MVLALVDSYRLGGRLPLLAKEVVLPGFDSLASFELSPKLLKNNVRTLCVCVCAWFV